MKRLIKAKKDQKPRPVMDNYHSLARNLESTEEEVGRVQEIATACIFGKTRPVSKADSGDESPLYGRGDYEPKDTDNNVDIYSSDEDQKLPSGMFDMSSETETDTADDGLSELTKEEEESYNKYIHEYFNNMMEGTDKLYS